MKSVGALAVFALAAVAQASVTWNQMGVFIEKNFDWVNVDAEIKSAIDHGYNRIYMGFYMSLYGCTGSCTAWANLDSATKNDVLNYAHTNGAQIILSIGGPGEFYEGIITEQNTTAQDFGTAAANFAVQHQFDGIDVYAQLSGSGTRQSVWADNGSFADCVGTLILCANFAGFDLNALSITSPAPYYSQEFIRNTTVLQEQYALSWFALDKNAAAGAQYAVSTINEIMINEDNNYMSYSDCFTKNTYIDPYYGNFGVGSAVQEVSNYGVSPYKISVFKAIDPMEESVHTGYVDPITLGGWGCQANTDFAWTGGWVGWTWNGQDTTNTYNWPTQLGNC